jgi:tetratricopeptide (TPR) repeat protein
MRIAIGLTLLMAAGPAIAQNQAEIGYERGSLGYEALVTNQNELALRQLTQDRSVPKSDPAKLINLGRAYARLGDIQRAEESFTAAIHCKEEMDLVLADGREMNSRKAARLSLRDLRSKRQLAAF